MDILNVIQQEFGLDPKITYLNHAAVAPWPKRTSDAVKAFADENHHLGAKNYLKWIEKESVLRQQFTDLINAPSKDDIALLKNTSEALSIVAHGLSWSTGDNIVISNQEFPSNSVVWHSLKNQGVEVREVDLGSGENPEQALIAACDKQTRLLSISSVQYATGLRMNLSVLGKACKQRGILFCVDAIQSIGAFEFDVQAIHADFAMADTHKWMLGPEAVAMFYCRAELREQLELHEFGWHMLQEPTNYLDSDWKFSNTAKRFECGSPNMLGIHAASASLSLIAEIGISAIQNLILEKTQFTIEQINKLSILDLISNPDTERQSGIVTFSSQNIASQRLYESLMKNNVICAARGGGVRFSAHFYTDVHKIKTAVELAAKIDE